MNAKRSFPSPSNEKLWYNRFAWVALKRRTFSNITSVCRQETRFPGKVYFNIKEDEKNSLQQLNSGIKTVSSSICRSRLGLTNRVFKNSVGSQVKYTIMAESIQFRF